jgi:signal transduction histidine kinase
MNDRGARRSGVRGTVASYRRAPASAEPLAADLADRALLEAQSEVAELIARNTALNETLTAIARTVERVAAPARCSILLVAGGQLRRGVAPSFPPSFLRLVDGLEIGPSGCSCGNAVARRARVIAKDTATDPLWAPYREVAEQYDIRACWSEPILDQHGTALGTFALYHRRPRDPSDIECRLLDAMARLVRIALVQHHKEEALREGEERMRERIGALEEARDRLERKGSQLARLAAQLTETRDVAEEARRTMSQFLANVSHELRTPLNAIIGFSDMIRTKAMSLSVERNREYGQFIYDSGHYLLNIINDILDFSTIEAGRIELHEEDFAIGPLVEDCARLITPQVKQAGLDLTTTLGRRLPPIRADRTKLKQILLNLLSNAVKFTPEGGQVAVNVSYAPIGEFLFEVRDTGIGMRAEDIAIVLQPFRQIEGPLNRRHAGTGLGLPLSEALVELHGGSLQITSEPGRGTSVLVHLPKARPGGPAAPPTRRRGGQKASGPRRK